MSITPRFQCSQTAESIIISVYCPSVRASDVEINVDDTLFSLHINPYFLRLNFSHPVIEDDASSAKYDPGSGYLTVTLTKQVKGEEFKDLDLLAKLLAPRPTLPQKVPSEEPIKLSTRGQYGFLDMHFNYFVNVSYTENEINELGVDAETCTISERRLKRLKHEDEKFDEEYYMGDFADDENIQALIHWEHPHAIDSEPFQYTEKENMTMLNLPQREYLATPAQTHSLYLTLIAFLFSYVYQSRMDQHDPTPESAWTICSLIPAFSALDPPPYDQPPPSFNPSQYTPQEILSTLVASYRRSLAFPLYRSFALAEKCRIDVASLLSKGKRTVFRCLLEMKSILDHHEVYYIYSKIWVDDFCVWLQAYANDDVLTQLDALVKDVVVPKSAIGWDLEELETLVLSESNERVPDSDDESEEGS
ncbi:hypothetical protein D9758_003180 [Tetrapyrgos nigripes]|uniref:CS domain-containing protein n=1 Tax=Tetrapyrgos nigripes TaxID=182062 RepID=A0A8H5LQ89_9AGAR|nr:hypothetical protein D9758_003180 [Tetrapyrgos nigripes]